MFPFPPSSIYVCPLSQGIPVTGLLLHVLLLSRLLLLAVSCFVLLWPSCVSLMQSRQKTLRVCDDLLGLPLDGCISFSGCSPCFVPDAAFLSASASSSSSDSAFSSSFFRLEPRLIFSVCGGGSGDGALDRRVRSVSRRGCLCSVVAALRFCSLFTIAETAGLGRSCETVAFP